MSEFLRGQLSVMLLLAVFYSIGLWLAGLRFALPVGVMTGLLVFIPFVGFSAGLLLALMAALLQAQGWPPIIGVAVVQPWATRRASCSRPIWSASASACIRLPSSSR